MKANAGRPAVMLAVIVMLGSSVAAWADQTPVDVSSVRQIEIGSLAPGEERVINFEDPEAAQFLISGKENRKVKITVEIENLLSLSDTRSDTQSNSLDLVITGYDCAYSLDDGETWTQFSSADLEEVVVLPKVEGPAKIGRVLLRIGGRVTAGASQQRGAYAGIVVVHAEYHEGTARRVPGSVSVFPQDDDLGGFDANGLEDYE